MEEGIIESSNYPDSYPDNVNKVRILLKVKMVNIYFIYLYLGADSTFLSLLNT